MRAVRFLRKSWPIWAVWIGTIFFLVGLAINPFWTLAIIWVGIMIVAFVMSIFAAIAMARKD